MRKLYNVVQATDRVTGETWDYQEPSRAEQHGVWAGYATDDDRITLTNVSVSARRYDAAISG